LGQKVHPIGFRLGINKERQARWFADDKTFATFLQEDLLIRGTIKRRLSDAGVPRVDIERSANQVGVTIHAAKPGIVIGKGGAKVEDLRRNLEGATGKKVRITISEIRQPELNATLLAQSVADQLVRRVAFRRAMKQAVGRAMRLGAKGVRVQVSGRLGGSEMSRREWEREGRVPLHTIRADIDYGKAEAHTTFGLIGVKAWVYRGDVGAGATAAPEPALPPPSRPGAPAGPAAVGPVSGAFPPEEEEAEVVLQEGQTLSFSPDEDEDEGDAPTEAR